MVLATFGHEPVDIASIYIGGGTPSLMDVDFLAEWLETVRGYGRLIPDYEFTIEANPESLSPEFAVGTRELGINRIVIGAQTFAVGLLQPLGRRQKMKDIYRAFYLCRLAGYDNIAADLIFGLPGQKIRQVKLDIERLAALEPTHISFYQLTVEPETGLAADIASGRITLPDEESVAAMYRFGVHLLADKGYLRYEVSNFAREGRICRHNLAYWTGAPYIGLGPAAHGFVNNHRYANRSNLAEYIAMLEGGRLPLAFVEELDNTQRLMETILLSLRTAEGIDKARLIRTFGEPALTILEGKAKAGYVSSGHLIDDLGFVRLSDSGFLLADTIIAGLAAQG
jgi:oxygen-independent coproporphyrinogen III oxidase